MRFQVPQFIDIEEKVFGPLTFKQFIYLAGGIGLSIICWVFLPKLVDLLFMAIVMLFSAALAFYKVNKKPFSMFLEAAIRYAFSKRLYIWRKVPKKITQKEKEEDDSAFSVPRLSDSRLRDLAWSLDVHDSLYSETEDARR